MGEISIYSTPLTTIRNVDRRVFLFLLVISLLNQPYDPIH